MEDNNQIKFALYLEDWDFETGNKKVLKKDGIEVTTTEYTKDYFDLRRRKIMIPMAEKRFTPIVENTNLHVV